MYKVLKFEKLINMLPEFYTNVARICEFRRFPDRDILFCWQGQNKKQGSRSAVTDWPAAASDGSAVCTGSAASAGNAEAGPDTATGPAVLKAHYDVVPAEEKNWEKDPFCAEVVDGVMWGRDATSTVR